MDDKEQRQAEWTERRAKAKIRKLTDLPPFKVPEDWLDGPGHSHYYTNGLSIEEVKRKVARDIEAGRIVHIHVHVHGEECNRNCTETFIQGAAGTVDQTAEHKREGALPPPSQAEVEAFQRGVRDDVGYGGPHDVVDPK